MAEEHDKRVTRSIRPALRLIRFAGPVEPAAVLAVAAFSGLLPLAQIALTKALTDRLAAGSTGGDLLALALLLGVVLAAGQIFAAVLRLAANHLSWTVGHAVRRRVLQTTASAEYRNFDDPDWYDRLRRAEDGAGWRTGAVVEAVLGLTASSLAIAGVFGILFTLRPVLLLLGIAAVLPVAFAELRASDVEAAFWVASTPEERRYDYIGTVLSTVRFAAEARAFGLGPHLLGRHEALGAARIDRQTNMAGRVGRGRLGAGLVAGVCVGAALIVLLRDSLRPGGSPGNLAGAIAGFTVVLLQLRTFVASLIWLGHESRFLADVFGVLATPVERSGGVAGSGAGSSVPAAVGVEVEGVWFAYPGQTTPALAGCDLRIEPGEIVALVGDNGAGKTTLVRLLLGLYHPDRGTIRVAGTDIAGADLADHRSRVGVLFSDFATYQLPIRDNVAFGRIDQPATDTDLWAALTAAAADDVARHLGGLDANAGRLFEGGHDLSAGQWQRLALARLCYRDAGLWILDEPTAALDPDTEAEIFGRLKTWLAGRSGLIISHRLSTIRHADRIAVLQAGHITETGTHHQLLNQHGRYAHLYKLQAANYQ
jgi:ABC-type multidrug transport system fused ATPase/permease subunit